MEVGISTASYFTKLQTEDAILDIGAHGLRLCEVFLNSFCEYEPDFAELLRARIAAAGLTVYSVHPMSTQFEPQLFSIHPRQRADGWKLFERVLADGKRIGATHYVMHGFANMSGAVKNVSLARIGPILVDLAALSKSYGIQLTLENVSWCMFRSPEFGLGLLDAIGAGPLKFTLDIKQAVRAGYDPLAFVEAVGSEIANLHLCDASFLPDGGYRLRMPGQGDVDFAAVKNALRNKGYTGPAFLEVYSDMYETIPSLYACYDSMRKIFE